MKPATPPPSATARIVLLGASNLAIALPMLAAHLPRRFGGPVEILVACGFGRSYGHRSRVLIRSIPGILECGLWDAIGPSPALPTYALLTDIGNDVVYGDAPQQIANWVGQCIERLKRHGPSIIVTRLPMESIHAMPERRFRVVRSVLFPGHELPYQSAIDRSRELDERIGALTEKHAVACVKLPGAWYGADPIHIRSGLLPHAWETILQPWGGEPAEIPRAPLRTRIAVRMATPQRWWLLGRPRGRVQPSVRLGGGTLVGLY